MYLKFVISGSIQEGKEIYAEGRRIEVQNKGEEEDIRGSHLAVEKTTE